MRVGVAWVSPPLSAVTDAGCYMMKQLMIRYPHGFFDGGIWDNEYAPALTTSAWEHNNYVLEICDNQDGAHRGRKTPKASPRRQRAKFKKGRRMTIVPTEICPAITTLVTKDIPLLEIRQSP